MSYNRVQRLSCNHTARPPFDLGFPAHKPPLGINCLDVQFATKLQVVCKRIPTLVSLRLLDWLH